MELEGNNTSEGVTVAPPAEVTADLSTGMDPVTAPPAEAGEAPAAAPGFVEGAPPVAGAAPAYQPDWKYQAAGEEKMVEEFWRPLVKSEEDFKRLRDVLSAADALPHHKERLQTYEAQIEEHAPTVRSVQRLRELYEKGDHERVLEGMGYTPDMLKDVVRGILKREQMPEEARALHDKNRELALANEKIELDNKTYQEAALRELSQRTDFELNAELGKAQFQKLKDVFEASRGLGTFRKFVIERGRQMCGSLGRHVPPSELLGSIAEEYAPFLAQAPAAAPAAPKKVVPNITATGGSPARPSIGSLDDLKKKLKQLQGEED